MKQKLIKIILVLIGLLVVIVCISMIGTAKAINPNSQKIAELSFELNELETHKRICLDNLSYKESIDNANGIHSHCAAYDERMMAVQEEIERLKEWKTESETEKDLSKLIYDEDGNCIWWIGCEKEEREPWQLNEEWTAQVMPNVEWDTSHDRFKKLCEAYGLDASQIRAVENHYWIKEWVIACITVAETSGGKRWYGNKNIGSVGSNDRWDRPTYALMEAWLEAIGKTLNNKYLWNIQTLWCLSNWGSCQSWDDNGKRYATSNWNRERNMVACLSTIYGNIDAKTFTVRR